MKMVFTKIIIIVVLIGLFSISCLAGSFYAGEKGNEGQTTYSPVPRHQSSPKPNYSGPSKRGPAVSIEQTVMDTIVRAPAKKADQWVMRQFNCNQKTARSMIERSVRYYQGQSRFWDVNAVTANVAKTLTPYVVFACDVFLTGGGVYQAASAVAKNMGNKQMALFATQGMNAICKTFYYFAKYGHHKHKKPKMGTAEDVFKYISDALNTFNTVFGTDLSTTPDKLNSIIGLVTDSNITAARKALAKGLIHVLTVETTGNVQKAPHSEMPTPYNISEMPMPGTVQINSEKGKEAKNKMSLGLNNGEAITFEFWSTRLRDGAKFGPHQVTISPTDTGCKISNSKGYKSIVHSCKLWESVEWTSYENTDYSSKQNWKFIKKNGKIIIQGTWSDTNKDTGSDKGGSL